MKIGEIVFVKFPYETGVADQAHPVLIIDILDDGRAVVAYGTSKQVDPSCPRADEVVISEADDLKESGLYRPTRFVISVRATTFVSRKPIGALPTHKYKQLYRAAVFCDLI